jgi:TolA-binding protein
MAEARLDKLEASERELAEALAKQKDRLDEQVAEVQKALEKLDRASRRTGADMGVQMEQVQTDLSGLRGQVDQYLHKLSELEQALSQIKDGAEKATSQQLAKEELNKKIEAIERPSDKKAFAELVIQKLGDDLATGRKLAEEWLNKYSKDPLAAKIHYELGVSFFDQKEWRAALSEFGEIVKSFAKSDYAPNALLKSSDCFASLKPPMKEESRLALEEIVNSYPKSEAAKAARAKLAQIKKGPKNIKK